MRGVFRRLWSLLDRRERRQLALLGGLVVVVGLFEVAGVASVIPFLTVLANPDVLVDNAHAAYLAEALNLSTERQFLVFLGGAAFLAVVLGQVVKAVSIYALVRFARMRGYAISARLLGTFLHQPYAWFLRRHSATLSTTVLSEVERVVDQALMPALRIVSQLVVLLALVLLLALMDPLAALVAAGVVGGSYVLIFSRSRRHLSRLGSECLAANHARYTLVQEVFGGIKDVKLRRLEGDYVDRFRDSAKRFAARQASSEIIGELPRYVLEAIAFGGMILVVLVILASRAGDLSQAMPVIGVYAFAGVRLFPALQILYRNFSMLRFAEPALAALSADAAAVDGGAPAARPSGAGGGEGRADLRRALVLRGVTFTYPGSDTPAVRDLDVTIAAHNRVAFVGGSGAGKTTTVDLVLGLLTPQAGTIEVDGHPLGAGSLAAWQARIGYVPQHIFLTDDTVAGNIAFGVPPAELDVRAVRRAARIAELHDFVTRELPEGYDTMVGERGVRLSGGQRQRIGIARALYHDPSVLIFDEATSALDNLTEQAVMAAVRNIGHDKTVILVAHRLSTVRNCDRIFLLDGGRCVATGSYEELLQNSAKFQALAEAAA